MSSESTTARFSSVAVCGAGTMGRGIALAAISAGFSVVLYEVYPAVLHKALTFIDEQLRKSVEKGRMTEAEAATTKNLLHPTEKMADVAEAELIIEAIIEQTEIKEELFSEIEAAGISATAVIASNTSSLPVSSLATRRKSPERFVGLHFFNPANIMKLVEVVRGARTSDETIRRVSEFARQVGKTPVITRDVPGFIVNRVARNYYNEAMRIATEGIATPEQIDRLMQSIGFKMGPFKLMDLIGNDVNLEVTKSVATQYFGEPRFTPSTMQQEIVFAGNYGAKTGRGFYDYSGNGK